MIESYYNMNRSRLILILIILHHLVTIIESADSDHGRFTNSVLLDRLLSSFINAGNPMNVAPVPTAHVNAAKKSLNQHESLPSSQWFPSSSRSSALDALANLASLTSTISSFSPSAIQSSFLTIPDRLRAQASAVIQNSLVTDPDADRSTQELITSRGFSYDDHYVITKDGTILHLFRINNPHAQAVLGLDNLHPVLLQHGFATSSSSWLSNSPGETVAPWVNRHRPLVTGNNLATFLANQGYDVWMGNNRGNRYSTNHTKLDFENDDKFWDFSIDEYAREDAPAMIDHILNVTGKAKLTVVGHSLGVTQFLGLLSFTPRYADAIDLLFALAPVGYLGHMNGPMGAFLATPLAHEVMQQFEGKFPPLDDIPFMESLMILCNNRIMRVLCSTALDYTGGINTKQLNQSRLFVYLKHLDPVSAKLFDHLFQVRQSNFFHLYDYGESENLIQYGLKEPPKYPYSNIDFDKFILVSGLNDAIASPEDVHQLRKKLSGKIFIDHIVKNPKWNHWDFVYGKSAYENVNKFILESMDKYSNKHLVNSHLNQIQSN